MAGTNVLRNAPYPNGPFVINIGGQAPNGLSDQEIDGFTLPWDAQVRSVRLTMNKTHSSVWPDGYKLRTVDSTAKQLIADVTSAPSAAKTGALESLHADIKGVTIKSGDRISLTMTTTTSNAQGYCRAQIELSPVWSRPKQTEL